MFPAIDPSVASIGIFAKLNRVRTRRRRRGAAASRVTVAAVFLTLVSLSARAGERDAGALASPCSIRLRGAIAATLACTASVTWNESKNLGAVSLTVAQPAPLQIVNVTLARPGPPAVGSWKGSDRRADGAVVVAKHGSPLPSWLASSAGDGIPAQGAYTLYVSTLTSSADTSYGRSYVAHGTLDATLAPQPKTGANGEVRVRASF